jgi:hypothetical protein
MTKPCVICQSGADIDRENEWYKYQCPRCGWFFISDNAVEIINEHHSKKNIRPVTFANISSWIRENQKTWIDTNQLDKLLKLETPLVNEKSEKILNALYKITDYPGKPITIKIDAKDINTLNLLADCWLFDCNELVYFLKHLSATRLISFESNSLSSSTLNISPKGFLYIDEIHKKINSNLCFCAMWFDEQLNPVWKNAIKLAINQAGYDAKRIDKHPYNTGVVDEIIAMIKRSKFVVVDLTGNRGGCYFEGGYAKALGLEVIFTCRSDKLEDIHFDVRHYNFLTWEEDKLENFKEQLRWRIESTLGRGNFDSTL